MILRAQMTQVLPVPFSVHTLFGAEAHTRSPSRFANRAEQHLGAITISELPEKPHDAGSTGRWSRCDGACRCRNEGTAGDDFEHFWMLLGGGTEAKMMERR